MYKNTDYSVFQIRFQEHLTSNHVELTVSIKLKFDNRYIWTSGAKIERLLLLASLNDRLNALFVVKSPENPLFVFVDWRSSVHRLKHGEFVR